MDDGSTDETERFCRSYQPNYSFQYLRQLNAGAGAARRRGVQHARGEYLLLINDDTIAAPDLLANHWKAHQNRQDARQCVLGDFRFPPAAQQPALTRFLTQSPFFFSSRDAAGRRVLGVHLCGDLQLERKAGRCTRRRLV